MNTKIVTKSPSRIVLRNATVNPYYECIHKEGDKHRVFRWLPFPHIANEEYQDDIFHIVYSYGSEESGKSISSNEHFIRNHEVWNYPSVKIVFVDGKENVIFFQTYKSAKEYYKKLMANYGLIELPEPKNECKKNGKSNN